MPTSGDNYEKTIEFVSHPYLPDRFEADTKTWVGLDMDAGSKSPLDPFQPRKQLYNPFSLFVSPHSPPSSPKVPLELQM